MTDILHSGTSPHFQNVILPLVLCSWVPVPQGRCPAACGVRLGQDARALSRQRDVSAVPDG
jgi:hypothetical protein